MKVQKHRQPKKKDLVLVDYKNNIPLPHKYRKITLDIKQININNLTK